MNRVLLVLLALVPNLALLAPAQGPRPGPAALGRFDAERGRLRGLEDAKLMAQKAAAEHAFRRRVMADEQLAVRFGDLWDQIAEVVGKRRRLEPRAKFHRGSGLLELAVAIVRSCDPAESAVRRARARPDATNSPRFGDGVVRGLPWNGTIAPHRTTFYGLYARNTEFDGEYPFNLPEIWHDREDRIDRATSLNFASSIDVSLGSSGSVVVDRELGVVGVVVDGNINALANDFVYRDDVPRAVSVHVDGITEALVKVYDARRIVRELTGQ